MPFNKDTPNINKIQNIAVIGLGYVGLPLAVSLSKNFQVTGFDTNQKRILDLKNGSDETFQFETSELVGTQVFFTGDENEIQGFDFYIVTVPTPVDNTNSPDLSMLESACQIVGRSMSRNSTVVIESTVYPGTTEEVCVQVLEQESGLMSCLDFHFGYSPERINPGDKIHTLDKVVKVVSACCFGTLETLERIYKTVTSAGVHVSSSIKIAEAAKIIENTQRDLNIALVNELSIIFDLMGVDTLEVLEAASTKWNFQKFSPGLVGGHCISVDPYYLTFKSKELGYTPKVILSGRSMNDSMPDVILRRLAGALKAKNLDLAKGKCLVLGLTFKENCPDTRNSGSMKLVKILMENKIDVTVWDPWVDKENLEVAVAEVYKDPSIFKNMRFDSVIIAVPHDSFNELGSWIRQGNFPGIVFDLKGFFPREIVDIRL